MSKYFKIFFSCILFYILIGFINNSIFAVDLSSSYNSISDCNNAVKKYNFEYNNYVRSSCYLGNDNKYYYNICETGIECGTSIQNSSNINSEDANAINSALGIISDENPNAKYFDDKILGTLKKIVDKLELEKVNKSAKDFNVLLSALDSKLDKVKLKFPNSIIIGHLIDYLKFDTNRLKADTDIEDFFCEITGGCPGTPYIPVLPPVDSPVLPSGPTPIVNPTTVNPTTVNPTTVNPTTVNPTTINPTTINPTTVNPSNLKCLLNGIEYIDGDVRCESNNRGQQRCDNGTFKHISSCDKHSVCSNKLERTSNGNFFTTCKREYEIFYTNNGVGSINGKVPESEVSGLKLNSSYECKYNDSTGLYGNCVYKGCMSIYHEEGNECIYNFRNCDIEGANKGRLIWTQENAWNGTCEWTSSSRCNAGYQERISSGPNGLTHTCVTGSNLCHSTNDPTGKKGVLISEVTPGLYDKVWRYDKDLSKACHWKCEEGYKPSSEIAGYRGSEFCVLKNICNYDEYYNGNWTSSQNANQACINCKGGIPYGNNAYLYSTKRPTYTNGISRNTSENDTWKYIDNTGLNNSQLVDLLKESCTWSCKAGYVVGKVKTGPITCCDPNNETCRNIDGSIRNN